MQSSRHLLCSTRRRVLAWAASGAGCAQVAQELRSLRAAAAARHISELATADGGGAALAEGLREIVRSDPALAAKLRAALAPPVRRLGDSDRQKPVN